VLASTERLQQTSERLQKGRQQLAQAEASGVHVAGAVALLLMLSPPMRLLLLLLLMLMLLWLGDLGYSTTLPLILADLVHIVPAAADYQRFGAPWLLP
jgi:hypothetical protein